VFNVFINNNQIRKLCEDTSFPLEFLDSRLKELNREVKELFRHLYDETISATTFLRAISGASMFDHYRKFRSINAIVCPFCGIEDYPDKKSGSRASYDHYLARALYPFAGVNFENLVPMCKGCNEWPNKHHNDILFTSKKRGKRRQVFFPYGDKSGIKVKVACVTKPSLEKKAGKWQVTLEPVNAKDSEKVKTWSRVFRLSPRLEARLEEKFDVWTRYFLASTFENAQCSVTALRSAFKHQAKILSAPYYLRNRRESVLQGAFFNYLGKDGEEEVLQSFCRISQTAYITSTAVLGKSLLE
jgi:hypothetical protein